MHTTEITEKASQLMPGLISDLEKLVAIPSIAFPGYPAEPVGEMADLTLRRFREVGFTNAQLMEVPTGYPPIFGEIQGPEGSPTAVLYAHNDVQPAPSDQGWTSEPGPPEDTAAARIHSSDESVDPGEIERMVVAQALLLPRLGERAL